MLAVRSRSAAMLLALSSGFLASFYSVAASAVGIRSDYVVRNWTTADGLPDNSVRAIVETPNGYLWVGTANGLARFDGERFTSFDPANSPALLSGDIFDLGVDEQGGLWLATLRGAFRYDEGRFTLMRDYHPDGKGPRPRLITDRENHLWVQTGTNFWQWNGSQLLPWPVAEGPEQIVRVQPEIARGFWITASNGFWQVRDGRATLVSSSAPPELVALDRGGVLWGIDHSTQLVRLNSGQWEKVADLPIRCFTIVAAKNGDLWLGAESDGYAYRWRDGQLLEIGPDQGLQGNRAITFAEDREGNIWLGMNGAGLYRLREKRVRVFNQAQGFGNTAMTSVIETSAGEIVAGVMGWNFYRRAGDNFTPIMLDSPGDSLRLATALAPATAGGIWAGTFSGPLLRVVENRVVERIGSTAGTRCLFVDREGGLWRGTRSGGVEHFVGDHFACFAVSNGLSFNNVYSLTQDREGAVWAGTEQGLNRIANGRITVFGRTNGLGHHFVTALCVDTKGTLWAGTLGGGLSAWNGTNFVTLTTREGLADDTVQQLIEDDLGQLWIGTRAGLMRVAVEDLHRFLSGATRVIHGTLIGRNEGLERPTSWTEYQPASAKARDGRLWICTGSGLALIDPRQFNTPVPLPIAHIQEITWDGQPPQDARGVNAGFIVPPRRQRVQIRYTGISPSAPEWLRFRYRLTGYESDWVEAGRERVASYSRIAPGRYEFEVMAVNNRGMWSTPARVAIQVQPAFWETLWFRSVAIAGFLALGPWFYVRRVRKLERRRRLQEEFSQKLIESQEAERRRLAAELHDGLGQNLVLVKNLAQLSSTSDGDLRTNVADIASAAHRAIDEVHAISYALRPPELDRLGLAKALSGMVRRSSEASGIKFDTRIEFDGKLPDGADIHLFRIAQEAVNNLIKHSGAKSARLELWRDENGVHLVIADDGRGLPSDKRDQGRAQPGLGLSGIEERARLIGAQCRWISTPRGGTTLSVLIPHS